MSNKLTAQQRLDRAHVSLLRNETTLPLSGIIMLGKNLISNKPQISTAATDGINKYYDEQFVLQLDDAEMRAVVMHENFHVMYKHLTVWQRLFKENQRKANVATDYVVNATIKSLDPSEQFLKPINKEPAIWLYDKKFDGMDVGQVYRTLTDKDMEKLGGGGGGLDSHNWEVAGEMSQEEVEQLAKEIDQAIRQGAMVAGKASAKKDRTFEGLMEPKVDWRKVLREWISTYCDGRDEATWRRPSRRWLQYDMYMPSMQGVSTGDGLVAIDTSGSTYVGGMLEKFLSEMNAIATAVQPEKMHVIYWESSVAAHEIYGREEMGNVIARTKPKGGGGTTMSCVTTYMAKENIKPKWAVVLTDGFVGSDWGGSWPCPVLWVIIGAKDVVPPFGVVVHAED